MPRANPVMHVDVTELWRAIAVQLARIDKNETWLAEMLGLSKQTLSGIHKAARSNSSYQPGGAILLSLCWWLGRDPRDFGRASGDET